MAPLIGPLRSGQNQGDEVSKVTQSGFDLSGCIIAETC